MNKAILIVAVLGIALAGLALVAAYRGDPTVQGPNYTETRHAAVQAALEAGDYDAWVAAMTADGKHPRIVDKISEENFLKFVQMHNAVISGDTQTAQQLRAELGLGNGQGKGKMNGFGKGNHLGMMKGNRNGGSARCPYAEA